jgi:hypothetical protein
MQTFVMADNPVAQPIEAADEAKDDDEQVNALLPVQAGKRPDWPGKKITSGWFLAEFSHMFLKLDKLSICPTENTSPPEPV